MAYTKQTWNDNDPTTPVSAARLAHLEDGIQAAQTAADNAKALGPNWVAASNAPTALKNGILNAGGSVCTGTNDHTTINNAFAVYKTVFLTEGTFTFGGSLIPVQSGSLIGSGIGTVIRGVSGLASPLISVTADRVRISQLYINGTGTSTSCHGISVAPSSSSGFLYGTESGTALDNLLIAGVGGDGIRYTGTFAGGGQVARVYLYGCGGKGFYTSSVEGSLNQLHVENCGSHGLMFDTGSAGWRVSNVKASANVGDGFFVNGSRQNLANVEAQDNQSAGFRLIGNAITLSGFTADSNSQTHVGFYSGVEVGLTAAFPSTTAAALPGGTDITLSGGQAWDRNPAGTRTQRSGIRVRANAVGLSIMGVTTGDTAGTLFNATNGIEFVQASDAAALTNCIYAISNRNLLHSS